MSSLKSVIVKLGEKEVGKIGLTPAGTCAFEYSEDFIKNGRSISPFELPLKQGVFLAKPEPFYGGFGVFDDSLPDGWGLLVQDRYLQSKGINPLSLNLLDRLALVGSLGRGALEFYPDYSVSGNNDFADFNELAIEANKILQNNDYYGKGLDEFQRKGGSPGGARPKVSVNLDGEEWLVKFPAKEDSDNIGQIEYNYSILAKKCGIEMPETRLFENKYFGVKRFDRKANQKFHYISVAALLRADYRLPSIDYSHIFKASSILTKKTEDLWKIFRLMTFNFLIGNKDDHAKNFAFILKDGDWHFAPAFDILPSNGFNGYHTTSINDTITPQKADLIEVAQNFGLSSKEAETEFNRISSIISSSNP